MVCPETPGKTACCCQHGISLPLLGSEESFISPCHNSLSERLCLAQPDELSVALAQQSEDKRDDQTVLFGLFSE